VTLGDPIINPSIYGEEGRLGAAILVALLAVATEVILAGVQRAVTPRGLAATPRRRLMTRTRTVLAALVALALSVGLVACGDDDEDSGSAGASTAQEAPAAAITRNAENASTTLTIGSKNFTEQQVLGEIYAQAFAAAGYKVRKELNLGDEQTALKALKEDEISGYPEYTGTALLSFFEVPTKELPKDPAAAYDEVKSRFAQDGITAFPPTPFTSSNEVAVTQETAQRLGLKTISDLEGKSQDLVMYGSPECRGRDDCLRGLQNVYGLEFKRFVPVDINQRHEVLANGDADVSIVFTTDPQISRNREVLLEDDKGMFPPYNSTFLMKTATAEKAGPDLQKTIEAVNRNLNARVMQELNARVDLDKETPADAAADYLQQFDLVSAGS
jgi:glycine betaine/choline ABC-type transport system substrate-binding protein